MNIVLVSQEYPPETARGGIGTQTYVKAHALSARGHKIIVISSTQGSDDIKSFDRQVRVIRISTRNLPMDTEEARWLSYSAKVASTIIDLYKKNNIDLIDFPEWGSEGYVYLLNRTEWNYIPVVIQIHGPVVMIAEMLGWPSKESYLYHLGMEMEKTCLRLADYVFSSSYLSTWWCAEHYSLDAEKIPRIHTGVDTDIFYPMNVPKSKHPTIVYAGRISEAKGIKYLIDAALDLADDMPNLKLYILGRGQKRAIESFKRKALDCGHPDLLDFRGFVSHEELRVYFSEAHVFAAPSLYEGGPGLVNLEAMACGLPVVASSGSGAAEVVIDGDNGLLAKPGDHSSIRKAIERILRSDELRKEMSSKAIQYVHKEALRENCIDKIESLYNSVLSSKNATT